MNKYNVDANLEASFNINFGNGPSSEMLASQNKKLDYAKHR